MTGFGSKRSEQTSRACFSGTGSEVVGAVSTPEKLARTRRERRSATVATHTNRHGSRGGCRIEAQSPLQRGPCLPNDIEHGGRNGTTARIREESNEGGAGGDEHGLLLGSTRDAWFLIRSRNKIAATPPEKSRDGLRLGVRILESYPKAGHRIQCRPDHRFDREGGFRGFDRFRGRRFFGVSRRQ